MLKRFKGYPLWASKASGLYKFLLMWFACFCTCIMQQLLSIVFTWFSFVPGLVLNIFVFSYNWPHQQIRTHTHHANAWNRHIFKKQTRLHSKYPTFSVALQNNKMKIIIIRRRIIINDNNKRANKNLEGLKLVVSLHAFLFKYSKCQDMPCYRAANHILAATRGHNSWDLLPVTVLQWFHHIKKFLMVEKFPPLMAQTLHTV